MGKQKSAKAEKQHKNKLEAAARTSRKWTKDFYRKNNEDKTPQSVDKFGQIASHAAISRIE